MGHGRYIGRVGALAVLLGIGVAVFDNPAVAYADEDVDDEPTESDETEPVLGTYRVDDGAVVGPPVMLSGRLDGPIRVNADGTRLLQSLLTEDPETGTWTGPSWFSMRGRSS